MEFYKKEVSEIEKKLETNVKEGLSQEEAKKRLDKYGKNKISKTKKISTIKIFFRQFLNPLMFILLIATILSLFIGELKDAIVIALAVIINVMLGFIQEWKAEKAALALKQFEILHSNVIRNNEKIKIKSELLVPGDIVLLDSGQKIPADIRLASLTDFMVEEAILTGESEPIEKQTEPIKNDVAVADRTNMAFSGTIVLNGKAKGIVIATAEKTQLGKIAQLVQETKEKETPLQSQIKRFSWILGIFYLTITILVFFLGLFKGITLYEIAMTSIALGVASIPEGLLIAVTAILAIGMQRMLKRKALVRHLVAAETLGSVSVICTDKTGTLTEGKMRLAKIVTKNNETSFKNDTEKELNDEIQELLEAGIINNDAQIKKDKEKTIGHPTEIAILKKAKELGFNIENINKKYPRINEIPFSSKTKYMATLHETDNKKIIIVKGAPEKIFEMASENNLEFFKDKTDEMTKQGLRILAFAKKDNIKKNLEDELNDLSLLGLVGINDPLRPQANQTVEELEKAGIKIVLVTGDHKETAKNIALKAGIDLKNGVVTGEELNKINEQELKNKIQDIDIFARVEPEHKIKIVNAWKANNKAVAMTGDGVNDAPALKAADIGVALGSGSDVAHEISDIVLLDDNLSSIDAAVKEGRTIFENIRKVIIYLMTDSFSEIVLIAGSLILNLPLPIIATQILWINIISDGIPYFGLLFEPPEKGIMLKPPRKKNEPIINKEMLTFILFVGIFTDIVLLGLFMILLKTKLELSHIQTIIFTTISINSLFYIFSIKNLKKSIFKINFFSNPMIIYSVLIGFSAQLAVIYLPILQDLFSTIPLNLKEWLIILPLSLTKVIGIEITKIFFYKNNVKN